MGDFGIDKYGIFFYRTQYLRTWAALGNMITFDPCEEYILVFYKNSLKTLDEFVVIDL